MRNYRRTMRRARWYALAGVLGYLAFWSGPMLIKHSAPALAMGSANTGNAYDRYNPLGVSNCGDCHKKQGGSLFGGNVGPGEAPGSFAHGPSRTERASGGLNAGGGAPAAQTGK